MGARDYVLWFFLALALVMLGFYVIDHLSWRLARKRVEKIIGVAPDDAHSVTPHDYLIEYGKVKGTMGDVPFIIEIEGGQILLIFGKPGAQGSAVCESLDDAFDVLQGQVYLTERVHE